MGRRSRPIASALLVAALSVVVLAPAAALASPITMPPTIAMTFGAPTLGLGNSTSLTFTIANPNVVSSLSGIGFGDTLPSGLMVATPSGLSGACGGGTITTGPTSVTLAGATLAPSTGCTFSVDITAISPGVQVNTTGNVTSTEGGAGGTATDSITVGWAPTLGMTFDPSTIPLNGTSELKFGVYNPETNSDDLVGLGFTLTLPAGLTVANGSKVVCPVDVGGSTVTGTVTTSGGNKVTLSGLTLPVSWVCSFSVTVTGPGRDVVLTAKSGVLTSTNGIPGAAATASIVVGNPNATAPPSSTTRIETLVNRSDPTLPLILLIAFVIGFAAVRRAAMRGVRADSR